MTVNDLIYLKDCIGEKDLESYLLTNYEKTTNFMDLIRYTCIKLIVSKNEMTDFGRKFIAGNYGKVFFELFLEYDHLLNDKVRLELINKFRNVGYKDEQVYLNLFDYFNEVATSLNFNFDYELFKKSAVEEIVEFASKETLETNDDTLITIEEYLRSGGNVSNLIKLLIANKSSKDINMQTKLVPSKLVSLLSVVKFPDEVVGELIEAYYECLNQQKNFDLSSMLSRAKDKPNLYKYLKDINMIKEDKTYKKVLSKDSINL